MNPYYNNYQERQEQKRQETETKERSFGEQMYPVAVAGRLAKLIIHMFSFSGAVILPAYAFELLFGSFFLGLIIGFICVLVFIEVPKWSTIDTIFENYYDGGFISYGLSMLAIVLMTPSITSSTFGIPILVDRMSPDAIVISLDDIKSDYKQQSEKAAAFYIPQVEQHSKDSKDYFTANRKKDRVTGEWRLSSSKAVKYPYNEMLKAGKDAQRALNSRLDSIHSNLTKSLVIATAKNETTVSSHNYKKANAGNIAFWVMLVLELCYVLIVWGLKYYEYRSKDERTGLDKAESNETSTNQTEQSRIVPIQNKPNQTEQPNNAEKQAVAKKRKIGFADEPNKKHGDWVTPIGSTKQMLYENKNGELVPKSKADLIRLKKRPKTTKKLEKKLDNLIALF